MDDYFLTPVHGQGEEAPIRMRFAFHVTKDV